MRVCFHKPANISNASYPHLGGLENGTESLANDIMIQLFGETRHGITITDKDPDYYVYFNYAPGDQPREKCIGLITEPQWSANRSATTLSENCHVVFAGDVTGLTNGIVEWVIAPHFTGHIDRVAPTHKTKSLSMIASHYRGNYNYTVRDDLALSLTHSDLDVDVYGRFRTIEGNCKGSPHDKWDGLAQYHRSVAIENCNESRYVTEKLVDCFLGNTQPIYLGCSKVLDIFGDAIVMLDTKDPMAQLRKLQEVPVDLKAVEHAKYLYRQHYNVMAILASYFGVL